MLGGSTSTTCHALLLALFMATTCTHAADFDIMKFGAKADGKTDDSKAIADVWKAACASPTPSTITIGKGQYMATNVAFTGPCKSPVTLHIQGTFKAQAEVKKRIAHDGWVSFENVDRLFVDGSAVFDGQGSLAWKLNDCAKTGICNSLPINIQFTGLSNSVIRGITSLNSKLFHMNILSCKNLTLQGTTIDAPPESLNTDGIHIGRSNGVNISGATIRTGDDCVSFGDGSQMVNIENVTCGPGHGISVGSLGRYPNEQPVRGVTVRNCTIFNTENGVRIKTWPASPAGLASNVRFEDIVMQNVSTPVLIDQEYCPHGKCKAQVPSRVRLSDISFRNIRGTSASKVAVRLMCSRGAPCSNVELADISLTYSGKDGAVASECSNIQPRVSGKMVPPACSQKPGAAPPS